MYRKSQITLICYLALTVTASAQPVQWKASKATGQVLRNEDSLHSGDYLDNGDRIRTGRTGRALLVHNRSKVIVNPNSRFQIPPTTGQSQLTELFQFHGTMQYDVAHAPWRRFRVRTPFLAIVVKGTAFEIDIQSDSTKVSVTRGAVQVIDADTGERTLLTPGQSVSTRHRPNAGLEQQIRRAGDLPETLNGGPPGIGGLPGGGTAAVNANAGISSGALNAEAGVSVDAGAGDIGVGVGVSANVGGALGGIGGGLGGDLGLD